MFDDATRMGRFADEDSPDRRESLRTAIAMSSGFTYDPSRMPSSSHVVRTHDSEQPVNAMMTVPIIFGLRVETPLKDMFATLTNNEYCAKGNDARVSLSLRCTYSVLTMDHLWLPVGKGLLTSFDHNHEDESS